MLDGGSGSGDMGFLPTPELLADLFRQGRRGTLEYKFPFGFKIPISQSFIRMHSTHCNSKMVSINKALKYIQDQQRV